jgi:hypothetical protein
MPGEKPTAEELSRRVDRVCGKINAGETTYSIIAYLKTEFGFTRRTAEMYVARARKRLRGTAGNVEDLRSDVYYRLLRIALNEKTTDRDKIRANLAIIHLLQLSGPVVAQPDANDADQLSIDRRRIKLAALIRGLQLRHRRLGASGDAAVPGASGNGKGEPGHDRESGQ